MIVDPDFLDHWRTRMVVDALGGDELAPTYILRLWAHCQTRKADRFTMPAAGLKAQCRYTGDAAAFEQALTDAGFVLRDGDTIHILNLDWLRTGRVLDVRSTVWESLREQVLERDRGCVYCGASEHLECDHVVPLALGGKSTPENLVASCRRCNRSKGSKPLEQWLGSNRYGIEHGAGQKH